jgi:hypothetical protein
LIFPWGWFDFDYNSDFNYFLGKGTDRNHDNYLFVLSNCRYMCCLGGILDVERYGADEEPEERSAKSRMISDAGEVWYSFLFVSRMPMP